MATKGAITDFKVGDDVDITRTITSVPDGTTLAKAWLYVKATETDADGAAVIGKAITTSSVNGVGQITDTGADGTGEVFFQMTSAETAALVARRRYWYAVKVMLNTNKVATVEAGVLTPEPGLISATS